MGTATDCFQRRFSAGIDGFSISFWSLNGGLIKSIFFLWLKSLFSENSGLS